MISNKDKNDIWEPNDGYGSLVVEPFICGDLLIDPRDWKSYNTVLIGTQCWMSENLKSKIYSDGTPLVDGSPVAGSILAPNSPTLNAACAAISPMYGMFL